MKCRDCKHYMTAYLHGELPPKLKRRMTLHIQQCPMCYTTYIQQRNLVRDLEQTVPLVGQPGRSRLDKVWTAIQADMAHPRSARPPFSSRFGLVAFALMVALLLPWTIGKQHTTLASVPTQPSPALSELVNTPDESGARASVAALFSMTASATPEAEPSLARAPGAPDTTP